jgi:hypothetical protein
VIKEGVSRSERPPVDIQKKPVLLVSAAEALRAGILPGRIDVLYKLDGPLAILREARGAVARKRLAE